MEQIENIMLQPQQRIKTSSEREAEYEAYLEEQDRNYEDSIFDELKGE